MPALLGVVLSYAALVSGVPGVGAGAQVDICAPGAGVCQAATEPTPQTETYATPVEVDCSALPGAPIDSSGGALALPGELLSSGCSLPAYDFRYRVSRFADSERPSGALGPQRNRRAPRTAATCEGLPPDHGGMVSASPPPLGIYAIVRLTPPAGIRAQFHREQRASTRVVEPLDRPPRA